MLWDLCNSDFMVIWTYQIDCDGFSNASWLCSVSPAFLKQDPRVAQLALANFHQKNILTKDRTKKTSWKKRAKCQQQTHQLDERQRLLQSPFSAELISPESSFLAVAITRTVECLHGSPGRTVTNLEKNPVKHGSMVTCHISLAPTFIPIFPRPPHCPTQETKSEVQWRILPVQFKVIAWCWLVSNGFIFKATWEICLNVPLTKGCHSFLTIIKDSSKQKKHNVS